jgi:hypothetical protein
VCDVFYVGKRLSHHRKKETLSCSKQTTKKNVSLKLANQILSKRFQSTAIRLQVFRSVTESEIGEGMLCRQTFNISLSTE